MNTFSHFLIGSLLMEHLKKQRGIELYALGFLNGSLQPDIKRSFKTRPHESDSWAGYIKSEIRKLASFKQESARFGRNYSRRLGIICHFYADFFCFPHTKAYDGGSVWHMKYEWSLHRYLKKNIKAICDASFGVASQAAKPGGGIYGGFEALQEEYLKLAPSYESDIIYTLRACADVLARITDASVVTRDDWMLIRPIPAEVLR